MLFVVNPINITISPRPVGLFCGWIKSQTFLNPQKINLEMKELQIMRITWAEMCMTAMQNSEIEGLDYEY